MSAFLLACLALFVLAVTGNEALAGAGLLLIVVLALVLGHIEERRRKQALDDWYWPGE